jgi:hypothetical protein
MAVLAGADGVRIEVNFRVRSDAPVLDNNNDLQAGEVGFETLAELTLHQHPDKIFVGRISRGFDVLGYVFTPAGLEVAPRAVERCVERVSRLYEQGADLVRIGAYVPRRDEPGPLVRRLGWRSFPGRPDVLPHQRNLHAALGRVGVHLNVGRLR